LWTAGPSVSKRKKTRKITYLFNPYFCVNTLEKQKCG
jgi:hypothetical protein